MKLPNPSELSTRPLNFWQDKSWHRLVHERLGEKLHYYLVRIRPLDHDEIRTKLTRFLEEQRLGSVRVFPIFGSFDLLIRAWLHPTFEVVFRKDLGSILVGKSLDTQFTVDEIDKRWYDQTLPVNNDFVESLDSDLIRSIQAGRDERQLQQLVDGRVVLVRHPNRTAITFFVAIAIEQDNFRTDVINGVREYLLGHHAISKPSIYSGHGFCSILFKGESEDYFAIAEFPNWIGKTYKTLEARTETYLVHGSTHLAGDQTIGEATFFALKGRDLCVQAIVPEIYDRQYLKRAEVERFLIDAVCPQQIASQDKSLFREYLIGYLNDDPIKMATTLFNFFSEVEGYLRRNHKEFVVRLTKRSLKEIYEIAQIEESKKFPSLGDMLRACSVAITTNESESIHLSGGWEDLVSLRNVIAHGSLDSLASWSDPITLLLKHLPRIRQLLGLIDRTIGKPYQGAYWEL